MFRLRTYRLAAMLLALSLLVPAAAFGEKTEATPEVTLAPSPAPIVATLPPQEGDVTEAAAVQTALDLMINALGMDERLLTESKFELRLGVLDEPPRVAVVIFTSKDSGSIFTVTLDAFTGIPFRASEFDASCLTTLLYEDLPALREQPEELADSDEFPYPAFLADPMGAAAHITQLPTDYDIPMGVYMNGTPVIVTGELAVDGEVLYAGDNAPIGWVQVTIGMQGDFDGISGFVPAHMLDKEIGSQAIYKLPQGALLTDSPTQHLSLYKSSNRSSDILGVYREGTTVLVMGRLRDWYHVRLGSLTGFVPVGNLTFDAETQELLKGLLPEAFDSVQPGVEDRYQKYMTAVDELWYKFGDSNDWPLSIKAQYSQLSLDWGFQDGPINILPKEGDLTEAEAQAIAQEAIKTKYDMTERDYAKVGVKYAFLPETPDKPEWTFRFYSMVPDLADCAVTLDKDGKVLSYWQDDAPARPAAYDPMSDLYKYTGVETMETPADLSRAKAEEIALRVYAEQTGENTNTVMVYTTLYANDTDRWWYVTFTQPETQEVLSFDVVVKSPGGEVAAHKSREEYAQMASEVWRTADIDELEKEKGRMFTWSLEDKHLYAPDMWGLPGEGHISQEEALAIAVKYMADTYGMTESELAKWQPYYRFDITEDPMWVIDFYTEEIISSNSLTGYTLYIDAETGDIVQAWSPEEQNG